MDGAALAAGTWVQAVVIQLHVPVPALVGRRALYLLGGLNVAATLLVTQWAYALCVVPARIATVWTVECFQRVRLSFRGRLRRRQLISQCSSYRGSHGPIIEAV
jgi:hypothetical protein